MGERRIRRYLIGERKKGVGYGREKESVGYGERESV